MLTSSLDLVALHTDINSNINNIGDIFLFDDWDSLTENHSGKKY